MKLPMDRMLLGSAFFFVLALLVVPVPPMVLDLMFSVSITLSLLVLMLALFAEKPLDFSVFPSFLLMLTMLRLGLNVASTRLILMKGGGGADAAGRVIQAFGEFTVGGSYTVGLVIFLIFVVINMVVITKGAGRIAEVAARFTLDAMPGKQMAIDADLNQGIIDDGEAKQRRRTIQREADFYGAMDGASKFVKGDAIAGIVIMLVNIVGGLAVGIFQNGMGVGDAAQAYTTLTVGDGLVGQIPALVVSTAAGVVVSRAGAGNSLASELRTQVFGQSHALLAVSGMLGAFALIPGLPFAPFAALAAGSLALSRIRLEPEVVEEPVPEVETESEEERLAGALVLDDLELEIGYGLIPLVDPERGGELLTRIRGTRRQLATELGFVVPLIHIRDNLELEPGGYRILLKGNAVATGSLPPGRWLAIRPGEGAPEIPGIPTRDPAFGLPAVWVQERDRERAASEGYAVVDPSTAVATHLAEVIRTYAAELLSRQHVRELLDQYSERAPKVVEDIVPSVVPLSMLHRTLRTLLGERVSIRDLAGVLETLAEYAPRIQDPDLLTDLVRERLGRTITRPYLDDDGTLQVITLDPVLEEKLRVGVQRSDSGSFLAVEPATLEQVVTGIQEAVQALGMGPDAKGPVLLASQAVRAPLRQVVARVVPRLAVLAHTELPPEVKVVAHAAVSGADAHQAL